MYIPKTKVGSWAQDIVDTCSVSLSERVNRGIAFRNMYLTGDSDSDSQIYNKCYSHIETISAHLFSPVELRFVIDSYGFTSPIHTAMYKTATSIFHSHVRSSNCDLEIANAVTWALVKGKTFIKLLWNKDGFEPVLIQPEMMGVYREDLGTLDKQQAFFQSTYYTPEAFYQFLEQNPDREEMMRKIGKYQDSKDKSPSRDSENAFKRIILSGIYPVGSSDSSSPSGGARNLVDWMGTPAPEFSPKVIASLIRVDELWVQDEDRDDYSTFQVVGDVVVSPKGMIRNMFSDMLDPDNSVKRLDDYSGNPLSGHHPYIEFCASPLDGYFWGRSEVCNVAMAQLAINKRVNGIGALLRRQEDPNYMFSGVQTSAKDLMAKLKKPGGHIVESNPGAKVEKVSPDLPQGLFDTLHEYMSMFEDMSGMTPTLSGRGESGVRSQAHSETLVRMSSPRIKEDAVRIERQVEAFGGLALDILRAKVAKQYTAWMMPKEVKGSKLASLFTRFSEEEFEDAPVAGMKPIKFALYHLPEDCKVMVDSHSASPAFSQDTRVLLLELAKFGAITPEKLVEHLHPPGADAMIEDLRRKEIQQQQFAEAHPELAAAEAEKAAKKHKK